MAGSSLTLARQFPSEIVKWGPPRWVKFSNSIAIWLFDSQRIWYRKVTFEADLLQTILRGKENPWVWNGSETLGQMLMVAAD